MPKPHAVVATLCIAATLALRSPIPAGVSPSTASAGGEGLTDATRLAAAYDTILQARFDDARDLLARTCPPAPGPACDALREVALFWEIQMNPADRTLDARFEATAAVAIAAATAWTKREPGRGEAWFYLAGSYGPLSQWRVLRGERLAAARDGKRIKDALERALALDARLQDAWFGIGLYHYYADVVPAALKVLRFLLLLPGGDRAQGMQEMLRARERGELLTGEADFQMHWIYLWYENEPAQALRLLQGLDGRYPSNPLFLQRIAEVEHEYFGDHAASAESWRTLIARAATARLSFASIAEARARVGLARELIELSQPAAAIAALAPVLRARPLEPYGVLALAQLTLGDAHASAGDREHAIDAYTQAIAGAPRDDPDAVRARARAALARARARR